MLHEVLVIVGMEVILLVSIATMTFHRKRTDVLSGRYFGNDPSNDVMPEVSTERIARQKSAPAPLEQKARTTSAPLLRNRHAVEGGSCGALTFATLLPPSSRRRWLELGVGDASDR